MTPLRVVVVAEDANRTGTAFSQADDGVDGGRLARTVGSEESVEFTAFDAQRDAVDRREIAVTLDESFDFDGGRGTRTVYGMSDFNRLYRWRRKVAMSSVLPGIPQSASWVATFFTSNATRRCLTCQPPLRSVKIA